MENVPQFLSSPQFPIFAEAFEKKDGALRDYRFKPAVLNAADYGAPQARKRVVVLGLHRDFGVPQMPAPSLLKAPMSVREAFDARENFAAIDEHVAEENVALPDGQYQVRRQTPSWRFKASELHFGRSYTDLSRNGSVRSLLVATGSTCPNT